MSIDETRAREEVAEIVRLSTSCGLTPNRTADHILDEFDALAGLLGYVKADDEEWGVRYSDGMVHFWATREEATDHAEVASRWRDAEVVHQHVSGWEVVTDAEQ